MSEYQYDQEFMIMQQEYLAEQSETVDDIETLFLAVEENFDDQPKMRELLRIVHSFKGASGSYDFQFLPIACHYIEDKIEQMRSDDGKKDFTIFFKIIDLMKDYISNYFEKGFSEKNIIDEFNVLKGDVVKKKASASTGMGAAEVKGTSSRILVLESTQTLSKAYRFLLSEMNVDFVTVKSGMDALSLLLREKYDVLITGTTTGILDGPSLIATAKVIKGPSQDVFTILTTSNTDLSLEEIYSPSQLVTKDADLLNNMKKILSSALKSEGATSPKAKEKSKKKDMVIEADDLVKVQPTAEPVNESPVEKPLPTSTLEVPTEDEGPVLTPDKVLIVDDDQAVRELIEFSFKKHEDIERDYAVTYEEGMEKITSFVPDVILLDYMLGDKTGEDFLKELKEKFTIEIPVIFLTGVTDPEEVAKLLSQSGCIGVLSKPFSPKKLYKQVVSLYDSEI